MSVQSHAYRADIDGLRAFAVLSVVLFHAFPTKLNGGFVGVDIFFVISGYLIGGIILRDLQQGTFSIANFYSRRIRRIFPALITVMLAALAFGWFALFPDEYKILAKHIIGGATFISNFVLWNEVGYFDTVAKTKPLLHLWSLGIEEQFYIFFPLLLWCCTKKHIRTTLIIIVLGILSFLDNMYLFQIDRTADFYSPLSRFWELLVGASLASLQQQGLYQRWFLTADKYCSKIIYDTPQDNDGHSLSCVLASLGLFMLILSLVLVREVNWYPGWRALMPVIGAALIIAAGQSNSINRILLGNPLAVFIGKVSYPFYLWHWVFISFAFIMNGGLDASTRWLRVGLVGLSFILSVITYNYIESPIRFSKTNLRIKTTCLALALIMCGSISAIIFKQDGAKHRKWTEDIDTMLSELKYPAIDKESQDKCLQVFPDWKEKSDVNVCGFQYASGNNTIALVGDSYAGHLYYGLIRMSGKHQGFTVFPASCAAPYINISSASRPPAPSFRKFGTELIDKAYEYILKDDKITTVVLSHNPGCSYHDIIDTQDRTLVDKDIILERGIRRTFDALAKANKRVIVLFANPPLPFPPTQAIERPLFSQRKDRFSRINLSENTSYNWYKKILYKVANDYKNIEFFDLADTFCDEKYCYIIRNGRILYSDSGHLSKSGSLYAAPDILNSIDNVDGSICPIRQ